MYDQRDIVLIPFPYTDLTGSKKRPALIVSNSHVNSSPDRICCLVTSKENKEGLVIDAPEEGKLNFKSWVKPHRLFTVHERIILKRVCKVSAAFHKKVYGRIQELIR